MDEEYLSIAAVSRGFGSLMRGVGIKTGRDHYHQYHHQFITIIIAIIFVIVIVLHHETCVASPFRCFARRGAARKS